MTAAWRELEAVMRTTFAQLGRRSPDVLVPDSLGEPVELAQVNRGCVGHSEHGQEITPRHGYARRSPTPR